MRLSWAQTVAGGITIAVVAGLLLLPGRVFGPDRVVPLAGPPAQAARSVQAAPPLKIPHLHRTPAKAPTLATAQRFTFVARPRTVVRTTPARASLKPYRSAVISKIAPTAPLVRPRVLAAALAQRHIATAPASSTAKTIAALTASLRKK